MGEYSGWMFWCGSGVRDGDLAGMDDVVVKMLAREVVLLTYWVRSSMILGEPLRGGPKCSRSSARCRSFLPDELLRDGRPASLLNRALMVPEATPEMERTLGSRSPQSHGR